MRIDAPGGDTVELHRRCWIGRGGATPPGCVRVSAADARLRLRSRLRVPAGRGVFKAGGDLGFHHGGPSLQELVIPVLTVRTDGARVGAPSGEPDRRSRACPTRSRTGSSASTLQLGGRNLALFGGADGRAARC